MNNGTERLLDSHFTVNLLFCRFFIVFSLGADRRTNRTQVTLERRTPNPLVKMLVSLVTFSWFAVAGLLLTGIVLYLVKDGLGINIFENISPLSNTLHALGICHQ